MISMCAIPAVVILSSLITDFFIAVQFWLPWNVTWGFGSTSWSGHYKLDAVVN